MIFWQLSENEVNVKLLHASGVAYGGVPVDVIGKMPEYE